MVFELIKNTYVIPLIMIALLINAIIPSKKFKHRQSKKSQAARAAKSQYTTIALLNKEEQRCFLIISAKLHSIKPNWHVFPQVSVGEAIKSKDFEGFAVSNNKRYDFLIVRYSKRISNYKRWDSFLQN